MTKTIATWRDLLDLDPSLREIDQMLRSFKPVIRASNQWELYERVKAQLTRRVGWQADHARPELQTADAYEIGIQHITDELGV
jgi:hypothetical protein